MGRTKDCETCHLLAPWHDSKPRVDYFAAKNGTGACIAVYGFKEQDRKACPPPAKKGFFSGGSRRKTRRLRRRRSQ